MKIQVALFWNSKIKQKILSIVWLFLSSSKYCNTYNYQISNKSFLN